MLNRKGFIYRVNLNIPRLPVSLEGLRIAHLTDLHVTRPRRRFDRIRTLLANVRVDLIVMTGDYINREGDEEACTQVMTRLTDLLRPRLGIYGVYGNHDTPKLKERLAKLPIHWLNNEMYWLDEAPVLLMGFAADTTRKPDSIAMLIGDGEHTGRPVVKGDQAGESLRLLLSHYPHYLPVAADLDVDIMLTGHTHGGQCRLPGGRALTNGCDLPLRMSSGILRHRQTLAVVSRGLGEVRLPFRLFCPHQLPVYTLRRGPLPGRTIDYIETVRRW